ncbi:helix-turn-helix domain-containing protein [Tahibacter harae]|uniref:AraC family transcriptional regulator n=1 Tax=Tahibacter harae TaxID=2963937 RepID=A0ABT1QUQ8_9GAMM|nr:AraC family transcriptional regulator [Tahibacter harae]MCQ4166024.1 AraC family transcriptional regulator [Tahibacter harae]
MIFWSIVFVIGASQALWLALALWRRPVNRPGNRVLAAWIALIGFDLVIKALYFSAPGPEYYKLYRFVGLFPFLYGSFFYVYVRALTGAGALVWRDGVHTAGFLFALLVKAPLFLQSHAQIEARFASGARDTPMLWFDVFLFGYSLSYVIAALVRVARYRRGLLAQRSDADRLSLGWIDTMAASQIVIWCIATVDWLAPTRWIDYPLIYGAVVLWMFTVGYLSLGQAELPAPAVAPPAPAAGALNGEDDARFPQVEARLLALMQREQLYREPALTIGQLARRSGYPEYLVSAVINRRFAGNFWEYINRQRIEAVRACLADSSDTRTILDIAYACGFTSKSTFNAAFKRSFGETPSAYRQRQAASGGG